MDRGEVTDACANHDDTKGEGSVVTTVGGGAPPQWECLRLFLQVCLDSTWKG